MRVSHGNRSGNLPVETPARPLANEPFEKGIADSNAPSHGRACASQRSQSIRSHLFCREGWVNVTPAGGKVFPTRGDARAVSMERVVVSLGGSVLVPDDRDDAYIAKLAKVLKTCARTVKVFVVTGGGRPSRYYIETGRALGASERRLDAFGIEITRMNARLLAVALGDDTNPDPARTVAEAARLAPRRRIVLMGGTRPGHTTDRVAAALAKAVRAVRIVNATSVDGVYSADPRKDPRAVRFERITHAELVRLSGARHEAAGPRIVFDPAGARVAARARIPILVVDGRDLGAVRRAVLGRPFHGTVVT